MGKTEQITAVEEGTTTLTIEPAKKEFRLVPTSTKGFYRIAANGPRFVVTERSRDILYDGGPFVGRIVGEKAGDGSRFSRIDIHYDGTNLNQVALADRLRDVCEEDGISYDETIGTNLDNFGGNVQRLQGVAKRLGARE